MFSEVEDDFGVEDSRCWHHHLWSHRHRFWRRPPIRGPLHLLILKLSIEKPMSGSDIRETLKNRFELEIPSPAIYTMLSMLEEKGFVVSSRGTSEKGVPRKIYRITEDGLTYLNERIEDLRKFKKILDYLLS